MSLDYRHRFQLYEDARERYLLDLEDIASLIGRFSGDPAANEAGITLTDLARLEGLRLERDLAYVEFVRCEAEIFHQLVARLLPEAVEEAQT
jgi:hypothetical protein